MTRLNTQFSVEGISVEFIVGNGSNTKKMLENQELIGGLTAHDKQETHEQLSQNKQTVIYIFTYFLSYFDFVTFNQNVIPGPSNQNDGFVVHLNPAPASLHSAAFNFKCNAHISRF